MPLLTIIILQSHVSTTSTNKSASVRRRRVPIAIVEHSNETPKPATFSETPMQLVSTPQALKQTMPLPPKSASPFNGNQNSSGKSPQFEQKPPPSKTNGATAHGGIFRSSGVSKLFHVPDTSTSQPAESVSARNGGTTRPIAAPMSLFEFVRSWELASSSVRWDLLCVSLFV